MEQRSGSGFIYLSHNYFINIQCFNKSYLLHIMLVPKCQNRFIIDIFFQKHL